MDRYMCDCYDDWVEKLPGTNPRALAIKEFFSTSEPIGMANNYGQNRPAFENTPAELAALTKEFNESHAFQDIRFISCAIATTFRARDRSDILTEDAYPVSELGGGDFYAEHKSSGEMRKIDPRNLASFDRRPEIRLYRRYVGVHGEEDRYARVQRSIRTYCGPRQGSLGILTNLQKCRQSFETVFVPAEDEDDGPMDAGRYDPEASGERMRGHGGGRPRHASEDFPGGQEHHPAAAAAPGPRAARLRTHAEFPIGFMRN